MTLYYLSIWKSPTHCQSTLLEICWMQPNPEMLAHLWDHDSN